MKAFTCNTCTAKLAEAACARAWLLHPAKEPLRAGILVLGKAYRIDQAAYNAASAHCGGCPRIKNAP